MSTRTAPLFVGKLTISALNNTIHWNEFDGGVPHDLSAQVANGSYWPFELSTAIGAAMSAESASSGHGYTYVATFDYEVGEIRVELQDPPPAEFYLKLTVAELGKLLTGGDQDSFFNNLDPGKLGFNHCGFQVLGAYPGYSQIFQPDQTCSLCWVPNEVMAFDPEREFRTDGLTTEARAADGTTVVRSWADWQIHNDDLEFPNWGGNWQTRTIQFQLLTKDVLDQWFNWFWGPYARLGHDLRFFPDRTNTSLYQPVALTGESLDIGLRGERMDGYDYYSQTISLRRNGVI